MAARLAQLIPCWDSVSSAIAAVVRRAHKSCAVQVDPLLKRLLDLFGDVGVVDLLLPLLPDEDLLVGLGTSCPQWWRIVASASFDAVVWRARCTDRWALPSPRAVHTTGPCDGEDAGGFGGGGGVATSWREACRLLARDAFFWDSTVSRDEMIYAPRDAQDGGAGCRRSTAARWCTKRRGHPDVSFAFGRAGFCAGVVRWRVRVCAMGDELRVGVTDDRAALLRGDFWGLSYQSPNIWCYSDGSMVDRAYAGGRRVGQPLCTWGPGDVISVELDFCQKALRFSVNGEPACELRGEHFPSGAKPLFPLAVLDEGGDAVELLPAGGGDGRRDGVEQGADLPLARGGEADSSEQKNSS